MQVYTADEVEAERLERLGRSVEPAGPGRWVPGSFGCHEALHMASVAHGVVADQLGDHLAVLMDPDFFRLAHEAEVALWNLYQAIGAKHLSAPPPPEDEPAVTDSSGCVFADLGVPKPEDTA